MSKIERETSAREACEFVTEFLDAKEKELGKPLEHAYIVIAATETGFAHVRDTRIPKEIAVEIFALLIEQLNLELKLEKSIDAKLNRKGN